MSKKKLQPAIRIVDGKRIDLKARREGRGIVIKPEGRPTIDRGRIERDRSRSDREINKLIKADGGKDGAILANVRVRITERRVDNRSIRCRPGTFEWRYGRNKQSMLFHAGSYFAQLMERSGVALASSIDFLRGITAGYQTGISESRLKAIQELAGVSQEIGRAAFSRMVDYCVLGRTASELARMHGEVDRDMAAILNSDLKAVASYFRFG